MTFQDKTLRNGTTIVYGFKDNAIKFQMVMTLEHDQDKLVVHGFLSVDSMNAFELMELYKFLEKNFKEKYLECQVVAEHARFYKRFLHVISNEKSKTFNEHDCELLLIDLHKGIQNFNYE